jgi:hypothetical protein
MEGLDYKGNCKRSSFTSSKINNEDGFHLSRSQEPLYHSLKTQKAVCLSTEQLFVFIRHFCVLFFIWVIFSLVLVSCSVNHGRVVSPVPISHFIILSDHYLCHPANITWPNPHVTSAIKTKLAGPSKTSISTHQAAWHHNSDDSHLSTHCHEDVKFYFSLYFCEIHNSCITFYELMYPFFCVWVWKHICNI